ncbi:MAG TPA: nitroreductase family deazaflavin-dependent oxidoreductase [Acidimicrobiales bacterium]|nr:nitroreductase family deazaflavin-dependent oxidoreductase [Acidimicrobiales bacterium]
MNAKDEVAKLVNTVHRTLFQVTNGRVGGTIVGMPAVILTTTGRKSGKKRTSMLTSPVQEGGRVVLVASYGGDERHPQWYLNLQNNSAVELVGFGKNQRMTARTANAEERADLWPKITERYKGYADYQTKTDREIPVVILEPTA